MAFVDSVSDWVQVGLNLGALATGGVVWKMYFENLKATVATREAEIDLANKQTDYWREQASELEKRTPEAVERLLAERIKIREAEIESLAQDRERSSQELKRVEQEVVVLQRSMEQTKGFREVLAMERPAPDDPDYQDYLDYMASRDQSPVEIEVVFLGMVGVDSGQLLITDPCYIDAYWADEPFDGDRAYRDTVTGAVHRLGKDFKRFDEVLEAYGKAPKDLVLDGRWSELPPPPPPTTYNYSYNGACQATLSDDGYGELTYPGGHHGAGVAFQSGWGDGFYPVYGEKHDGRIVRIYVNAGAEPAPELPPATSDGPPASSAE